MVIPQYIASTLLNTRPAYPGNPYLPIGSKMLRVRSRGTALPLARMLVMVINDETGDVTKEEISSSEDLFFRSVDILNFIRTEGVDYWAGDWHLLAAPQLFEPQPLRTTTYKYYYANTISTNVNATITYTPYVAVTPAPAENPAPRVANSIAERRNQIAAERQRIAAETRRLTRDRWNNGR